MIRKTGWAICLILLFSATSLAAEKKQPEATIIVSFEVCESSCRLSPAVFQMAQDFFNKLNLLLIEWWHNGGRTQVRGDWRVSLKEVYLISGHRIPTLGIYVGRDGNSSAPILVSPRHQVDPGMLRVFAEQVIDKLLTSQQSKKKGEGR